MTLTEATDSIRERAQRRNHYGVFVTPDPSGYGRPSVSSFARPKFAWARLAKGGRVHAIKTIIFRWNHMSGTWERPFVTIHTACHATSTWWQAVNDPDRGELCLRCVGHVIGGER